jgi:MFS transporter, SP family, inositol transporter
VGPNEQEGTTREQWRRTLLAAMANYIDAGSIVAAAVALPIWAKHFGFGTSFVSFLGAFSSNAIAAGLGALIGGRICDLLGRKKIYQWDLLLYAFGTLWIVFAFQEWMLLIGFFIVGLTVGADVPASWTLITETAPKEKRGRFAGLAQLLWYLGAIAPLLLGIALLDLGMLATRIIFAHLLVVALITWAMRQGMKESSIWSDAQKREREEGTSGQAIKTLLSRRHAGALAFLIVMYGVWNLVAGTYGIFFPYILDAVGSTTDRANLALQAIWFVSTALAVALVYMPLIDRVNRRTMLIWSTALQLAAFIPFIFFDVTFLTSLINVVLFGAGAGIGQQSLFQLWSGELFPTLLRSTAQGFMFGVVRIALGGWILLLPWVEKWGFRTLSAILFAMLFVSGLVGILFAPDTTGRDLQETQNAATGRRPSGRFTSRV